jgi:hypothetical protein
MIDSRSKHWFAILGGLTVLMSGVAACASGNSVVGGSAAPVASVGVSPHRISSPSPAPSDVGGTPVATPSASGGLNVSRTCADVAAIKTLNDQFNTPGKSLAQGRVLTASLKKAADALVLNETDDTSTDAHTFDAEIAVVIPFIDKATSLAQLGKEANANPTLSSALSQISTAESNLAGWSAANC